VAGARPARVVVAGGGPAGAVTALVLARRGVPVTVVESRASPEAKVGETLPPSVAPLLAHLGLEAGFEGGDGHLRSHGNRAVWGSAEPYDAPFLANPHGAGWHVDRRRFAADLARAAIAAGADWRWGCELVRAVRNGAGWRVELRRRAGRSGEGGQAGAWTWTGRGSEETRLAPSGAGAGRLGAGEPETLEAAFVADATGRASRLARRLGARRVRYDRLVGVATLLPPHPASEDTYTLVEAVEGGWWYSALLADGRLAVALLTDGDLLDRRLRAGDPEAWRRHLGETSETRARVEAHGAAAPATRPGSDQHHPEGGLGTTGPSRGAEAATSEAARPPWRSVPTQPAARDASTLRVQPAETSRLDRIAGPGWLAVGDAAAAYDPLSSQGIGSAMGSGLYAGHAVADHLAGRPEAIPAYVHLLQEAYGTCLDLQRRHYRRERRWAEAPFWRRRHAPGYALEPFSPSRSAPAAGYA
jgi:flavin-dependent dehydrogenase